MGPEFALWPSGQRQQKRHAARSSGPGILTIYQFIYLFFSVLMRAGVPGAGLKVCAGDAGSHPERGAVGGAEMTYREDMSPSTQPDGRASSLSPRYQMERSPE